MAFLVDALGEAVGSVKSFMRPTVATPLPSGWVILDGSTVSDPDSIFDGYTLIDMRSKFVRGHSSLTNSNFGSDVTYALGGAGAAIETGGTSSHNLAHSHAAGAHTHTLGSHTHTVSSDGSHTHTVANHTHDVTIPSDGNHSHGGLTGAPSATFGTDSAVFFDVASNNHNHTITTDGAHDHGTTITTGSGGSGNTGSAGVHDHGGATGAAVGNTGAGSGNTNSALTSIDNKPPFVGLIWIMKIK